MCGGGRAPAPPPAPPPVPKVEDVKQSVDDLTESEKKRKGQKSTVLTLSLIHI